MAYQFIPKVRELSASSAPLHAFILMLDIADHCYGNLEASYKASGEGDTDEPFQAMDECMVSLIACLEKELPPGSGEEGEKFVVKPAEGDVGTAWDELRASVMAGKSRPTTQENLSLRRARVEDMSTLFERRRERRAALLKDGGDWAGNALNELAETRKRIGAYMIGEDFFAKSIEALAKLKGWMCLSTVHR
ncbi:hypothetical protein B0T16DRAFT_461373 [Cercophora newfieldiana]|uniref:Uncharacterized protein n=1 Tax=Cercophora newfieldiana TaxID=92897 RepID=A0AA39XW02_9PEZI|nr:hypothetical protein B0T16DRAFT_461373 [Cercophora newfieldiana]